uniref:Uncharacterized protein n=1 Tax=Romanomermis culicivorax TaxID=13658 RepID=A0A915JP97_ROMCU
TRHFFYVFKSLPPNDKKTANQKKFPQSTTISEFLEFSSNSGEYQRLRAKMMVSEVKPQKSRALADGIFGDKSWKNKAKKGAQESRDLADAVKNGEMEDQSRRL